VCESSVQLASVLEAGMLPSNKFTRRSGDVRGQSLYLPGVLRAAATDWTYRRIFAVKNKGGRREHSLVLAIDVSHSMHRSHASEAVEAVVMWAEALQLVGVDWSLLTFGERVTLVKAEHQAWDEAAQYALLTCLTFDQQGAALDVSVDLACRSPHKGRHVVVVTDGWGTSGRLQVARALLRAQEAGVSVLGVGVGLERTGVPACFSRWITALLPSQIPHAVERLFTGDAQAPAAGTAQDQVSVSRPSSLSEDSGDSILSSQTAKVFEKLVAGLGGASQLSVKHTQPDAMTVDVAFIIDVTGSMTAW
jgi:hypothetical protein